MRKYCLIVVLLIFAGCLAACQKEQPRPQETYTQYHTHRITSQGETLAAISKWYTGSVNNWKVILSHNPGLDVKRMRIGTVIHIPNYLVSRTEVMPRVKTAVAKAKTDKPAEQKENVTEAEDPADGAADDSSEIAGQQQGDEDEVTVRQLSREEMDQILAESSAAQENQAAKIEQSAAAKAEEEEKSFLSKFSEAAAKAKADAQPDNKPAAESDPMNAALKTEEIVDPSIPADKMDEYQREAKAAEEAANEQIKAAQQQAAIAAQEAEKQAAAAQPNAEVQNKTRDQLIKELTQDY